LESGNKYNVIDIQYFIDKEFTA